MLKAPRRIITRLCTALISAGLCLAASAQDDLRLPDLGSSANALISDQEAENYGGAMLRQMRALDMVVDDPLLDDYINHLGYRLVAACDKPKDHFAFFIVKDPEINAFAAPGGYIAVNSGLITITRSESELAGVIAHEIGHITQNHLQRAFEASKKDAPLMALVLLGAIAAGAGAHAGDAAGAILMGGQGAILQKQINFTRKDETEADRVGIQTLAKADFDPHAMAAFFERMADTLRAGSGGNDVPSLLQDHPVTTLRISDAKARAGALAAMQKQRPAGTTLDAGQWARATAPIAFVKDPTTLVTAAGNAPAMDTYALMRERVRVLAGDALKLSSYYSANLPRREFDTLANRYGYALALSRSGRGDKAIGVLQPLLASHPDNLVLRLAMADAQLQAGHRAAALAIYADANSDSPRNPAVTLAYAKALIQAGASQGEASQGDAARAATLLRPALDTSEDPDIFRTYARASERAGDSARAGEAYADASYLSGRPFDALEQLKRLLKRDDLDYYARARIQARIAELTPLVLELRKRKVQTEDNPDRGTR
ncbi:M48 family metalloprotease [Dyella sp.]|jgi:predicted Zn-dependent protease|uniref:M48 family metalloprotease n=1 Tax=Dyella sp. TaxID=1869338 RepID=UPI002D76DD9A|nr:M48 family metalloprotease [Dyella sp.]HET6430862.1 M48 family metalloprotease [Dyella sp.]